MLLERIREARLSVNLTVLDGKGECLGIKRSELRILLSPRRLELLEDLLALLVHCCNERSQLALLLGLAVRALSLTLALTAPLLERELGRHAREDAEGRQLLLNRQDRLLGVGGRHASALGVSHFSLFEIFGGYWKFRAAQRSILHDFFQFSRTDNKKGFCSCYLGFVLVFLS